MTTWLRSCTGHVVGACKHGVVKPVWCAVEITKRLIGLLRPYIQSHTSLAGQVRPFLTYVQMQLNGLRMTYFTSTRAATDSLVQATKQMLNQSQRT
jgi:hypothetical protein